MSRTTRGQLEQLVRIISNRLGRPEYGWNRVGDRNVAHVGALTLNYDYGQPRLHEVVSAGGAVREVGPRLSTGQMEERLRGILEGIEFAEANTGGYGSLPKWGEVDWDAAPGSNRRKASVRRALSVRMAGHDRW